MTEAEAQSTVLVVDDDPGLLRLIRRALERAGVNVLTGENVPNAVVTLRDHPVDLLLLDLKLPDMTGQALIDTLKAARPGVPFIIITGQGDERVAVEMMKRGALDYLVKDSEFIELIPTRVGRALAQIAKDVKIAAAEENWRKEHAFTTALLNVCGALVVAFDLEGKIVRFNTACERVTGFRSEEVLGRDPWSLFIPPEEAEAVRAVFKRLCRGEPHNEIESHWITRDGQQRLINWSNAALLGKRGEVEYIIATGLDVTEHRRLEKEVLRIVELEQRRIGHDLHDGICQHLAGIELMSQVLQQKLEKRSRVLASQAGQIANYVREALAQTRMLARGLSPVVLESDGLMSALQELAHLTEKIFRVKCTFTCKGAVLVSDHAVAAHLYRIAQEAVSNAIKHGKATTIEISLGRNSDRLVLSVHDNGVGFAAPASGSAKGMGLRIMQYRAGIIGGSLAIQRHSEGGTSVVCSIQHRTEIPS